VISLGRRGQVFGNDAGPLIAFAFDATAISVFVCSIAILPSAMVINTPSASTRMLTTPLPIVPVVRNRVGGPWARCS
jgi:hypothetical protein